MVGFLSTKLLMLNTMKISFTEKLLDNIVAIQKHDIALVIPKNLPVLAGLSNSQLAQQTNERYLSLVPGNSLRFT